MTDQLKFSDFTDLDFLCIEEEKRVAKEQLKIVRLYPNLSDIGIEAFKYYSRKMSNLRTLRARLTASNPIKQAGWI